MYDIFNNLIGTSGCKPGVDNTMLQHVLDKVEDGIFITDHNCSIIYCNKAASTILSVDGAVVLGKDLRTLFKKAKLAEAAKQFNHFSSDSTAKHLESYCIPLGKWLKFEISILQDKCICYIKDVTRGKKTAGEKGSLEDLHEVVVNSTNDLIWSIDKDYKLVEANNAFVHQLAVFSGTFIKPGTSVLQGFSEDHLMRWKSFYDRALKGESFKIEYSMRLPDADQQRQSEVMFSPLTGPDGQVAGVACYSRSITEYKRYLAQIEQANKELRDKEQMLTRTAQRLQTILNSSVDMICTTDRKGRFVEVNDACRQMIGYEPHELIGKPFLNFVHPDDVRHTLKTAADIHRSNKMQAFKNRCICKNGEEVYIVWSTQWDAKEQLAFSMGINTTALVKERQQREESEKKFKVMVEKGLEMVAIVDSSGRYKFTGHNVKQNLGYSQHDLVGVNALDLIHPEDRAKIEKHLAKLVSEPDENIRDEFRFLDKANEWRWLEVSATSLIHDPAINGIVINSRDVTERHIKDEELRRTNERLETVLKISHEVIWEWDIPTGIVLTNNHYDLVFGDEERPGQTTFEKWLHNIHEDDRASVEQNIRQKVKRADASTWRMEYRFQKADGNFAHVVHRGLVLTDKHGEPVKMVCAMKDITESRRYQDEREMIIKELTETNDDLKQFSFITSHNLRAPLSNVLGLLNIFEEENLDATNATLLELLRTSATQLNDTISDLTKIIVIRSRAEVSNQKVNLAEAFNNVKKIFLNTLNDIPYVINANFQVEEAHIHVAYLESIFINLLSNAIKYRSFSGTLQLTVATSTNSDGHLQLIFADNGIGFDVEKVRDRLFGMYQRFHCNNNGKGMGLYMVRSQVIAMGGSIEIDSKVNVGTTLTITLPFHQKQQLPSVY